MIEFNRLSFHYHSLEAQNLQNITLTINSGEFVLLLGLSGSGKSTLLRTINGLIPHFYGGKYSGEVKIFGKSVIFQKTHDLAKSIGMVFQNPDNQLFMRTVEREIAFGLENLNIPPTEIKNRISDVLDQLNIKKLQFRNINTLSGGEKQKVALAAILAMDPEILILDEPASELDPHSTREFFNLIKTIHQQHQKTIILTSHRLDWVLDLCTKILMIQDGKFLTFETPNQFYHRIHEDAKFVIPSIIRFGRYLGYSGEGNLQEKLMSNYYKRYKIDLAQYLQSKNLVTQFNYSANNHMDLENLPEFKSDSGNHTLDHLKSEALSFKYENAKELCIREIDMQFQKGKLYSIIGHNGSGKSTFLKLLAGILKPTSGKVILSGKSMSDWSLKEISQKIGLVFQNPGLQFYRDSVGKEISHMISRFHKVTDVEQRLIRLLHQFHLTKYEHRYPRYLSQGEQQRLAIALVIARSPQILLLDEPTHGMDVFQKETMAKILKSLKQEGVTIILATHDTELVGQLADSILLLNNGQMESKGDPHALLPKLEEFIPTFTRYLKESFSHKTNIISLEEFQKVNKNAKI